MTVLDRIHTTDTATALRMDMLVLAALLVLLANPGAIPRGRPDPGRVDRLHRQPATRIGARLDFRHRGPTKP